MGLPATTTDRPLSLQEYFQNEAKSEARHEYRGGVVRSMAGGSYRHSVILVKLLGILDRRLQGKNCAALESNLRVRIPRKPYYYYPDASVVCGPPQFDPSAPAETTILNPTVLVEVLSESTEAFDRGEKFTDYREIESLREYMLVTQHTPRVEIYLRQGDGSWRFSAVEGLEAVAQLVSVDVAVPLKELYAGV